MPPAGLVAQLTERGLFQDKPRFEVLVGGRTNLVWKVLDQSREAVLKLYRRDVDNPLFRNDPRLETLCLRTLDHTAIAPKFLAHGPYNGGDWVLYDHAPGACWSSKPEPVAQLLHRLHQVAPPKDVPLGCNGSDDLFTHTEVILSQCSDTTRGKLSYRLTRAPVASLHQRRFIHGDPVPGNILMQGDQTVLIDWQCPAFGDPSEDLAMFLSPAMQSLYRGTPLSDVETQQFLAAYPDAEVVSRYLTLRPWYHLRMCAYCLWRAERGAADYVTAFALEHAALISS